MKITKTQLKRLIESTIHKEQRGGFRPDLGEVEDERFQDNINFGSPGDEFADELVKELKEVLSRNPSFATNEFTYNNKFFDTFRALVSRKVTQGIDNATLDSKRAREDSF